MVTSTRRKSLLADARGSEIGKLRAWWSHRQGLDSAVQVASAASVLKQSGWARSVGGSSPYLTFFSRSGMSRETVDQAVASLAIHELPSARGCTYVVPAEDFSLALHLAKNAGPGEMRVAEKLGVTAKEIDKLCVAVQAALEKGPLDPDGIRQAAGKAVRSLGPEGQKKGLSSTLPVALGELQQNGEIRRVPVNGRLDQQRYKYCLWRPNPLQKVKVDSEAVLAQLAVRFFQWIAPTRLSDFQAFAGVSAKAIRSAVETLKLEAIFEADDGLLVPASLREEFECFKPAKDPNYHFVTALDSLLLLHRDLTLLIDNEDIEHPLLACKSGLLAMLPGPAIVDRGRVVGTWEYDTSTESIVYVSFVKQDSVLKKAIAAMEEYIRTQLGDVRTGSLDSPKSRAPRIEALRKANR